MARKRPKTYTDRFVVAVLVVVVVLRVVVVVAAFSHASPNGGHCQEGVWPRGGWQVDGGSR